MLSGPRNCNCITDIHSFLWGIFTIVHANGDSACSCIIVYERSVYLTRLTSLRVVHRQQNLQASFHVADNALIMSEGNATMVSAAEGHVTRATRVTSAVSLASGDPRQSVDDIVKSTKKQNSWLLHIKMLLVVTVPIVAVIIAFGLSLNDSVVARNSALRTVSDFDIFAEINLLVTKIRAERGLSITFVVLGGYDAETTVQLAGYRDQTDQALSALTEWPAGLQIAGVHLVTKSDLAASLTAIRHQVDGLMVNYNDVTDYYSYITSTFMDWLEVNDVTMYFWCMFLYFFRVVCYYIVMYE